MLVAQNITIEQIKAYKYILNVQGITAVGTIYQALSSKGYGYAGWAYGVSSGDSVTGNGALDYMKTVRKASGLPPLTDTEVNNIREGMLKGYLDALEAQAETTG